MPKELNNGKVTESLQRAFGFKGRYIPMLDEVIVPVYVIADPSPASVTRLCAATGNVVGDAGIDRNWIGLFNPVASGMVVNVSNVVVSSDVKQVMVIAFLDDVTGSGVRTTNFFRDRRNPGLPSTELRIDTNTAALVGDEVARIQVDGALSQTASWETQSGDPRQPLAVLGPGNGLIVQQESNLLDLDIIQVNFRYLEIPATETNPFGGIPG